MLIIMILSFTIVSASGSKSTTTTTISNSYNTYNNNIPSPHVSYNKYPTRYYKTNKPYYYNSYDYYDKVPTIYYKTNKPYYYDDRDYLKYNYRPYRDYKYSRYKYEYSKGIFGNEINDYQVYLQNKEHNSGYFTVKFYLADYEGKIRTESVTHYLKPYEGKIFRYKNVFDDEYDYAWDYKIISYVKTSNKEYYPRYRY